MVPASIAGLPTLRVPAGAGTPMVMQLPWSAGDDLAVLQLGELYHQATDWPSPHPSGLDTLSVYSAV